MANFDVIEDANLRLERESLSGSTVASDEDDFEQEPVLIRGVGHLTLFGLSNKFDVEFPAKLTAKLAPEEFLQSITKINKVLSRTMPLNIRWLLCGCVCCCCTMGLSMWPVVYLNRRTKHSLEKILDAENCNLYHRLGLHWRLKKQLTDSSNMMEYKKKGPLIICAQGWSRREAGWVTQILATPKVLLLEFRKKQMIFKPD